MKNEAKKYSVSGNIVRLVLLFLLCGFALSVMMFSAISFGSELPNESSEWGKRTGQAVLMGIFSSFLTMPLALFTAAITALLGYKVLGKLPLWYLLVLLPVCTIALCVQNRVDGFFFSEITWRYIVKGLVPIIISYLLVYCRLRTCS